MAVKGSIPWNKGLKGVQVPWNKGTVGVMVAWNKGLKGTQQANKTSFKKGLTPWNKGVHIKLSDGLSKWRLEGGTHKGRKLPTLMEEGNKKWKGDSVGYGALHDWVKRRLGKASLCSECFSTDNVQWANKSQEYKRELSDWLQLCASCHAKYDGIGYKSWAKRRELYGESGRRVSV